MADKVNYLSIPNAASAYRLFKNDLSADMFLPAYSD